MKRHASLVELSRDHHDGLLLAVRLQQGTKALLRLWSHDPLWQAEFVVRFWEDHLRKHFEAEEQLLFPPAERYLPDRSAVEQLKNEHAEMRRMVDSFRTPAASDLPEQLTAFGRLLESHIRLEERDFFPQCEEHFPESVQADILATMQSYRA